MQLARVCEVWTTRSQVQRCAVEILEVAVGDGRRDARLAVPQRTFPPLRGFAAQAPEPEADGRGAHGAADHELPSAQTITCS